MYFIEIYWKSESRLVFCKVFSISFTLESMQLNTGPLFICSLVHRLWLSSANKRVTSQHCWVWGVSVCTKLPVLVPSHRGGRGEILGSCLYLQAVPPWPVWGDLWQCDDFDVQKGRKDWLSRPELIQKFWWKCWEVKDHALKKKRGFVNLIVSFVFRTYASVYWRIF